MFYITDITAAQHRLVIDNAGNVGIDDATPTSKLYVNGSFSVPIATIASNTDYTLTANDHTILVNAGNDVVNTDITLPDAGTCTGRTYVIKKVDAGGDGIDLITNGVQTVDGTDDPTGVIGSQYHSITIQSDGSNWYIIGEKKTP